MDKLITFVEIVSPFLTHPLVLVGVIVIVLSIIIIKFLNNIIANIVSTKKKSANKRVSSEIIAINEAVANKISAEEALANKKFIDAKKAINKKLTQRITSEKDSTESKFLDEKKNIHALIATKISAEESLANESFIVAQHTINEKLIQRIAFEKDFTESKFLDEKKNIHALISDKISIEKNLANKKVSDSKIAVNEARDNEILAYQQEANQHMINIKESIDNEIATKISVEEDLANKIVLSEIEHIHEQIINRISIEHKNLNYKYPPSFQEIKKAYGKNNKLHSNLERGAAILSTNEELEQYLFSYGNMHESKLKETYQALFSHLNIYNKKIEILDYGCGQGLASISLLNYIEASNYYIFNVLKIILIEPSVVALDRAYYLLSESSRVHYLNKYLNDINENDLKTNNNSIKIHLFSNILDMGGKHFDLKKLSYSIIKSQRGINYFICVSPLSKGKLNDFMNLFKYYNGFEILSSFDGTFPNKSSWKIKYNIFKIGA